MRLKTILFESVNEIDFVNVINQAIKRNRSNPVSLLIGDDATEFYNLNKNKINSILRNVSDFSYLGAGENGIAFKIDDRVLKLQQVDQRAKDISKKYSDKEEKGLLYPMIYDHGTLTLDPNSSFYVKLWDVKTIDYTILEKFETKLTESHRFLIDRVVQEISMKMTYPNPITKKEYTAEELYEVIKQEVENDDRYKTMESELRLKKGWLKLLVDNMVKLQSEGKLDAMGANYGIRRSGGEGYIVFFD